MTKILRKLVRRLAIVLPLVCALHLSGVTCLVTELFAPEQADCCDPCEDALPGHACPPSCATCACAFGGHATVPGDGTAISPQLASGLTALLAPSRAHEEPDLDGVFHPPRA